MPAPCRANISWLGQRWHPLMRIGQRDWRFLGICQNFTIAFSGLTYRSVCGTACGFNPDYKLRSGSLGTINTATYNGALPGWEGTGATIDWDAGSPGCLSLSRLDPYVLLVPVDNGTIKRLAVRCDRQQSPAAPSFFYGEINLCDFSCETGIVVPNKITSSTCITGAMSAGWVYSPNPEPCAWGGQAVVTFNPPCPPL